MKNFNPTNSSLFALLISVVSLACISMFLSCSEDNISEPITVDVSNSDRDLDKNELLVKFSSVLSEIVTEDECLRSYLKSEAVSEFDMNYDILWAKVRDEIIGNCSLRQKVVNKTSEKFVSQLECIIPRLNILFSELPNGASAKEYDPSNNDLPVALRLGEKILLFSNGLCEDTLALDEIPLFNVLVVNENTKVKVSSPTRGCSMDYYFIHPEFDNRKNAATRSGDEMISALQIENPSVLYSDAINAYKYFYTVEDGQNSYKYQRDYIYFGITPDKPEGKFDGNVREYISFIKVSPKAFCRISDDNSDPHTTTETRKKRNYNEQEIREFITRCWTEGSFEFVFSIAKSSTASETGRGSEMECKISVKPSDLWEIDINENVNTYKSRKASIGNHSRYTIEIKDFEKMKPKTYFIPPKEVSYMGIWDIQKESTVRYFTIYELDNEAETTYEWENDFTFVNKQKYNVSVEGTYCGVTGKLSYENEANRTNTYSQKVTRKVHTGSDSFGKEIPIYYNDPIIKKVNNNGELEANCYNFDDFSFGLVATH